MYTLAISFYISEFIKVCRDRDRGHILVPYSVFVLYHSKDVRLPQNLQRAMAAEAEATREAKAKVCPFLWFVI